MARPNNAERVAIAERRNTALTMRLAGIDCVTIGRKLAADPKANLDGKAYPHGYGIETYKKKLPPPDDAAFSKAASGDIARALAERHDSSTETREQARELESQRLDRMIGAVWRQATAGDLAAVDRVLRILERRARLLGLDMATEMRLTGADGGPIAVTVEMLDEKIAALIDATADDADSD